MLQSVIIKEWCKVCGEELDKGSQRIGEHTCRPCRKHQYMEEESTYYMFSSPVGGKVSGPFKLMDKNQARKKHI